MQRKAFKNVQNFVRPMLDYASVVWDGCTNSEFDKLDKLQLYTPRIVTGLPIFAP